ncbi:SET domain-containing protein [Ferrimonas balearica]|uniref:SET domain-containing protein n=1 Tax=Ferrimonas balearica TaxID=44012 RepID=UPI001C55C9C3|nr:SET domain-containing protein [Ferrimonas balearica]MBW3139222.1 SET domain-containing protein [Ferrimonas balearica]
MEEFSVQDHTQDLEFVRSATLSTIVNTEIRPSALHGFGLHATAPIAAGTLLCVLDGQVMPIAHYQKMEAQIGPSLGPFRKYVYMECNYLDNQTLLARNFRTSYSYINHARDANTELVPHPLRLVALRDIAADEEMTVDYRKEQLSDDYLNDPAKQFL